MRILGLFPYIFNVCRSLISKISIKSAQNYKYMFESLKMTLIPKLVYIDLSIWKTCLVEQTYISESEQDINCGSPPSSVLFDPKQIYSNEIYIRLSHNFKGKQKCIHEDPFVHFQIVSQKHSLSLLWPQWPLWLYSPQDLKF